jgi:cobalt-precorrin 5A hydrolase/precorrin-3B C17-methyltransferase
VTVLAVTLSERGRRLAELLPYEHAHGDAAEVVRSRFREVDGLVLVAAVGLAVRLVAPLLSSKGEDPAVVALDEAGQFAVAVAGSHGHGRPLGANALAREVAALTGAQPVVTTSSDLTGTAALDDLPGFKASGDLAGVGAALLGGERVKLENPMGWPVPDVVRSRFSGSASAPGPPSSPGSGSIPASQTERAAEARVVVTDEVLDPHPRTAFLHPPSLVVGVGLSTDARAEDLAEVVATALAEARLCSASVAEVATIDRRAAHEAVAALRLPVRAYGQAELSAVQVPHPSSRVAAAVGTPSVAEAAALLAAGPGATLVVPKRRGRRATVAVARRASPRGKLSVVGLGPGDPRHRTPAATTAVRRADLVIGYAPYLELCADLLSPSQDVVRSSIGDELGRARLAVQKAAAGRHVALVCSGDPGVYAMASPALEAAFAAPPGPSAFDLEVVPGVTAASAASALLGAPLGHDHAVVSLSDLLTPWDLIAERLEAVARADLAIALYNPRSTRRQWQLGAAREILLRHRSPSTPVGLVSDAARPGERVVLTTLGALDPKAATMTTVVLVGCSTTWVAENRMVTPRGYSR